MRKKQKFILPLMLSCALAFGSAGLSATAIQAPMIADGGMTQEQILTQDSMQSAANLAASERSLPAGAQRTGVNINGRQVLGGRVFTVDGTTYVPMFKFCDWLGVFSYSYNSTAKRATVSGTNLSISATEGALYIVANGRYFYTVEEVLEVGGEIYVPIRALTKALNSRLEWSNTEGQFRVYSGDTRLLKSSSQVYRDDEIYWLSRIINAEAGGESMQGKIAVGNVILNRVRSSAFPNTIYSVIFDKRYGVQFAPTANGSIYKTPSEESIIAAKMCIEGYSLSTEVLYFFNPRVSPSNWISKNRAFAFAVGNHRFYY